MRGLAQPFALALLAMPLVFGGLAGSAHAADVAAGKHVFHSQCAMCHSNEPGVNKIGPSLFGVVGRHTGSEPGYDYSVANKNANLVWTPAVLDKYINHPQAVVPGTKMPYGGLHNATKRANLIAYLETLKKAGAIAARGASGHVIGQATTTASSKG